MRICSTLHYVAILLDSYYPPLQLPPPRLLCFLQSRLPSYHRLHRQHRSAVRHRPAPIMQVSLPSLLVPSSARSLLVSVPIFFVRRGQRDQVAHSREALDGSVMRMWQDVHESDDDRDADLGAVTLA